MAGEGDARAFPGSSLTGHGGTGAAGPKTLSCWLAVMAYEFRTNANEMRRVGAQDGRRVGVDSPLRRLEIQEGAGSPPLYPMPLSDQFPVRDCALAQGRRSSRHVPPCRTR